MRESKAKRYAIWLVPALVLILAAGYFYNLTGWLIFDDEGEYLYQVWRMTLGEMPYRDFMTPQLPTFLYGGLAVMKLFGPTLFAMRAYSVLLAFLSGLLLFAAGRRHHSTLAGALAMVLFLVHADIFKETRIFRNEPIFLFFVTAAVVAATWRTKDRRKHLLLAGVCISLATLAKLFGLLPAGGIGLWLLWDAYRRKRTIPVLFQDVMFLTLPVVILLIAAFAGFSWITPAFYDLVIGHHLNQGSELAAGDVATSKLSLYWEYFSFYPAFVSMALVSAWSGFSRNDGRVPWLWQIPSVLAFLFLSRQFGQRHFMYLLPTFSLLVAWLLADAFQGKYRKWGGVLGAIALFLILMPAIRQNVDRAGWLDNQTQQLLTIIEENTQPSDVILSDDIGLAFYSRRATTYSGAALSHGAITSGQITGEILIEEMLDDNVALVIVDSSLLTGNHIVFLRDYPRFHRFLERNFVYKGNVRRDFQELDVWVRDPAIPYDAQDHLNMMVEDGSPFGDHMTLLGYDLPVGALAPGDTLDFTLYWQADAPAENYWSVFTHLISPDGTLVGQHDKVPYGGVYPPNRWWPGQVVDDDYAISIPADALPGEYQIQIGMYDWITQERLSLKTKAGQPIPDNQIILKTTVRVGP